MKQLLNGITGSKWFWATVIVLASCIPIFVQRSASASMLTDTDTTFILAGIRHRHAPLTWFFTDWPLGNHFYRPVSTLSFELDDRLFHGAAWGFGFTNALLCIVCVLALFWFLRELTSSLFVSTASAVLFAMQVSGRSDLFQSPLQWAAASVCILGMMRHTWRVWCWAPAALVLWYVSQEVVAGGELAARTISWLPGRTATVMTVFCLTSLAAYVRYERLSADRIPPKPSPLELPATKKSEQPKVAGASAWGWGALSVLLAALALASYEQAVMLPAALLASALTMRWSGFKVRWQWQAGFWGLLLGYLALRHAVVPSGVSSYQAQQYRHGPGVAMALLDYVFPALNTVRGFLATLDQGVYVLFGSAAYLFAVGMAANLTALFQMRRRWVLALAGYGMSLIAFLPMAWVKPFAHYQFWPLALRSTFTVSLVLVAGELVVSALSPRAIQAPRRSGPAPGSLPHR